jgi:hypothetical protein
MRDLNVCEIEEVSGGIPMAIYFLVSYSVSYYLSH